GLDLVRQSTHELTYRAPRRPPPYVDVAWRPYRPPVRVTAVVDLTLGPGETRVRHELRYQLPAATGTGRLALHVPAAAAGLRVVRWGKLVEGVAGPVEERTVHLTPDEARQPVVVLEYTVPLPSSGDATLFPLVTPDKITDGESRVRIWAGPGGLPTP